MDSRASKPLPGPGGRGSRNSPRRRPSGGSWIRAGAWLTALAISASGALALGQSSVDELASRLESRDARTRRDAARDLGREASEAAIRVLNEAAADPDPDPEVRRAVLDALLSFRRTAAAPGLIAMLDDEDEDFRRAAIGGLVEMHSRDSPASRPARAVAWLLRREDEFVLDPLRPVAPEILRALGMRLSDEESDIRELAAEALGALRGASEAEALARAAAADSERDVQREAVRALGQIRTDEAGALLVDLLDTPDLRVEAVRALGLMAHRPAGTALLGIYDEDPDSGLGRDALEALARMGHAGARGTFYHELGSRDARRREYAAEGLGRIGDPSLVDGLIRDFLREDDGRVQLAFCFALVRLGQSPFVDRIVLSLTDGSLGETARQYALEIGAEGMPEFVRYLDDPDKDLRLELVMLLERIGDPEAIPALEAVTGDPDSQLADRARLAVRRLQARIRPEAGEPSRP